MSIQVTCYEGSDGLTVRIDSNLQDDMKQIRSIFLQLANGRIDQFQLGTLQSIKFEGLKSLTFKRLEGSRERRKTFEAHQVGNTMPEFTLSLTSEGWRDCVFWMNGLVNPPGARHQYLTDGSDDDAILVVAIGEL